jgi:hypothetical protein
MVSRNMRTVIQDETLKRSLAIAKSFGANNWNFFARTVGLRCSKMPEMREVTTSLST